MNTLSKGALLVFVAALPLVTSIADAQQAPSFYPAKGQDQAQQSKDLSECQAWASQQAGAYGVPPPSAGAPRVGGAARGAAGGAAIGAIAGDAGKGAAIGAVSGVMIGGARARQERRNAEAAASAQSSAFSQGMSACMQGRGYTGG